MTKMNPEVKARWVAALRSGEYQQTTHTLKDSRGFCCLGVLCDLYAQEAGMRSWSSKQLSDAADPLKNSIHGNEESLPRATVCIWAGLDLDKHVRIDGRAEKLFNHNDGVHVPRRTFAEIADAVEAQL